MYIHPSADVQSNKIGKETKIWQYTVVLTGAVIGENSNINAHCFIENKVTIGNNVTIKCGVYLWDCITIEDDVVIGPNATFVNDLNPRSKRYPDIRPETYIKKGASIGANATILGGITIGEYAIIGAGSVVTKSIPANTLWYGNPAEMKGYVCNCGFNLTEDLRCTNCSKKYNKLNDDTIVLCKETCQL